MKAVILMYLEDDAEGVEGLLREHEVMAYSEMPIEGHGLGTTGWYGKVAPFKSRMLLAFLAAAKTDELIEAVERCSACVDREHPIHAWVVDVERAVASGAAVQNGEMHS